MTSPLGKILKEMWPSFHQQSMDLVNLAIHKSKAVADREHQKVSLELEKRDLELQQRMQEVAIQKPTRPGDISFSDSAIRPYSAVTTSGAFFIHTNTWLLCFKHQVYAYLQRQKDHQFYRLEPVGPECFLYWHRVSACHSAHTLFSCLP